MSVTDLYGAHYAAHVTQSTPQSVAASTPTAISFDTEVIEHPANSFHDGAEPTRLTCPAGGYGHYIVGGYAEVDNQADQKVLLLTVRKNGSTTVGSLGRTLSSGASADHGSAGSLLVLLADGDYLELMVTQTDTVSRDVRVSLLWLCRVGH